MYQVKDAFLPQLLFSQKCQQVYYYYYLCSVVVSFYVTPSSHSILRSAFSQKYISYHRIRPETQNRHCSKSEQSKNICIVESAKFTPRNKKITILE